VRDLSDFLTARGYNRRFVENQIGRVRRLTRVEAFRDTQEMEEPPLW